MISSSYQVADLLSYDITDSLQNLCVYAGFRDENYNRNTAKRKASTLVNKTNYTFAPKLDAAALARDTSLMHL